MEYEEALPPYLVPHSQEDIVVLYQDDDLLLVNKPAFLLSVPGRHPLNQDSLIRRLAGLFPEVEAVHRLDLDTSGVMIVPKHKKALGHIARQFQERTIDKEYRALVWGDVANPTGEIDLPIARDWENRPRQKICPESGKPSLTRYTVLAKRPGRTLLQLNPVTGRSHQLRIHLRELGHPIIGCDMYAHPEALAASPRLLLHATKIAFTHPRSGMRLYAFCPAPFDVTS
jgi:tRNA pseudouridine32 synthase/23S rRNA pseudouridine746 synthase